MTDAKFAAAGRSALRQRLGGRHREGAHALGALSDDLYDTDRTRPAIISGSEEIQAA